MSWTDSGQVKIDGSRPAISHALRYVSKKSDFVADLLFLPISSSSQESPRLSAATVQRSWVWIAILVRNNATVVGTDAFIDREIDQPPGLRGFRIVGMVFEIRYQSHDAV